MQGRHKQRMKRMRKSLREAIGGAKQEMPVEDLFLHDLEKTIVVSEHSSRQKKVISTHYKPSALNCLRQMFYYKRGEEVDGTQTRDASMVGILQCGTDRHERLQAAMVKMKELTDGRWEYVDVATFIKEKKIKNVVVKGKNGIETKCYNKVYDLSFQCDGILKYTDTSGKVFYFILEIKTETSRKFWARRDYDDKHVNQGVCYSLSFGIDSVLFLYECRDDCNKKPYIFKVETKDKDRVVAQMANCDAFLKANRLPPKHTNTTLCKWCDYRGRCRKDG